MKITFIATLKAYWGGSEVLWVKCAELAIAHGHSVQVVVYEQKESLHPSLISLKKISASFVELKNDDLPNSLIDKGLIAIKNRLVPLNLKPVAKFNPDKLIINQVGNYSAPFHPLLYGFLVRFKYPFYLISQFNSEHQCLTWHDITKARFIFGKAHKLFFVSNRNKKVTERQLAIDVNNAVIIDNPINLIDVDYVDYPSDDVIINFASVARLEAQFKSQDILLQVLAENSWKDRQWILNIYGTGPDEIYLKELSRYYGIEQKVKFHGHVSDVKRVWEINHALLMPSAAEGKPLALEEAMICGRIAIASDVAGNAELVDHGINGYISSSFFPKPFGETLEKAWNERSLWKDKGLQAHKKMIATLDFKPQETVLKEMGAC